MCPVRFELNGMFCGRAKEPGSGVILNTKPSYHLEWSGDDSKQQELSVWRLDEQSKIKKEIARVPLPKTGDYFTMDIDIYEKVNFPKGGRVVSEKELRATRIG